MNEHDTKLSKTHIIRVTESLLISRVNIFYDRKIKTSSLKFKARKKGYTQQLLKLRTPCGGGSVILLFVFGRFLICIWHTKISILSFMCRCFAFVFAFAFLFFLFFFCFAAGFYVISVFVVIFFFAKLLAPAGSHLLSVCLFVLQTLGEFEKELE